MVTKYFIDEHGNHLLAFANRNSQCYIEIKDTDNDFYSKFIILDIDDLREFISELTLIERIITEDEK